MTEDTRAALIDRLEEAVGRYDDGEVQQSSHDHGNCELCDWLERDRAEGIELLRDCLVALRAQQEERETAARTLKVALELRDTERHIHEVQLAARDTDLAFQRARADEWMAVAERQGCALANLHDDVRELRAAYAQRLTWLPIETAPKEDGVLVLLHPSRCWAEDADPCDCEVGYWDDYTQTWESQGPTAGDYTGPTHWMPLPAPPSEGPDYAE